MRSKPLIDDQQKTEDASPPPASNQKPVPRAASPTTVSPSRPAFAVKIGVALLLVGITVAVFGRACQYGFLLYDDNHYVTSNQQVCRGLSWETLAWAFQPDTLVAANWHPLTLVAHLLDVRLFGLDPRGHHAMSIAMHALNVVLLLLVLTRLTGQFWPSALVAALFAWHPLHVESVAWIAERKDVLSTLFWLLTLAAYIGYVTRRSWYRYTLVALCLALGLLAKPMLVTVPAVLLLLDFWPLRRWRGGQPLQGNLPAPPAQVPGDHSDQQPASTSKCPETCPTSAATTPNKTASAASHNNSFADTHGGVSIDRHSIVRLVAEKVPLFVLVAAFSAITLQAQHRASAVADLRQVPLEFRIKNAVVSYVAYLEQTAWPTRLAAIYPMLQDNVRPMRLAWSAIVLGAVSAAVVWQIRKRPYLAVGWFWYLGTLVPVIGLVQVGGQARADRYTYVPLIGVFLMIAFGAAELARRGPKWRTSIIGASIAWLLVLAPLAWRQVGYWQNHITLFRHTLEVTGPNYLAHYHLANGLTRRMLDGPWATPAERQAVFDEAIEHYRRSLRLAPSFSKAHYNFACALWHGEQFEEAAKHFHAAIQLGLDGPVMRIALAECLEKLGRTEEARQQYAEALARDPRSRDALLAYARLSEQLGETKQQVAAYQQWLRVHPDDADILRRLAWIFATNPRANIRNGRQAVALARQAAEQTSYQHPRVLETLAAAYAETGDFKSAVRLASQAAAIWQTLQSQASETDPSTNSPFDPEQITSALDRLQRQIERYRRRRPWRSTPSDRRARLPSA